MDGNAEVSVEEMDGIIALAFSQDRLSLEEAAAAMALVEATGIFPTSIGSLMDYLNENIDEEGAQELLEVVHLVEDSMLEAFGELVHYGYDANDDATLSAREFVDLTRDFTNAEFDYFLDSWDNRVGDNDMMELDEFKGFWEELVTPENLDREGLLDWMAYADLA